MIGSLLRVAAAVSLAVSAVPGAAEAEPWRAVTPETGQIRDIDELEALTQDFPDSASVRLRLLQPYLEAGEVEKLLDMLGWLKARGYVFGEVAQQQIPKLVGAEYSEQAQGLLIPAAEVIAASQLAETTPEEAGLVESVVRDPVENRIIVTSVSARSVFARRAPGGWDGYAPEDAANLSGIALAPGSRIVWIASGHIDGSDREGGFAGLIGLDHDTNSEIRIAAPPGASLSDITATKHGTIYASDPQGGGIYRAESDSDEMEVLVAPGTFRSPQGLAQSEDETKLYVSDYRYGIAIVDLETREVSRLTTQLPLILDGVDGMWLYGSELIVVQNGTSPMRIAAFELSPDGMEVIGHRLLEQQHPDWTEPLSGNIDGDALLYVANGQWDRFVQGESAQDKPPLPTMIRRLPLVQTID